MSDDSDRPRDERESLRRLLVELQKIDPRIVDVEGQLFFEFEREGVSAAPDATDDPAPWVMLPTGSDAPN